MHTGPLCRRVLWSSWLWRLLYTQKVPSSILGRAICVYFFWPGGALFARAFFVRAGPGQPARAPAQGPQGRLALPQYGHGWLQRHEKKKKKPTHGLCSSGRFPGPVYRARHRQLQRIPARSWLGTYWPQKRRSRLTNKNDQHTNPHSIL